MYFEMFLKTQYRIFECYYRKKSQLRHVSAQSDSYLK